MSTRVYEIIAAGAAETFWARISDKMTQRRRIARFCQSKSIDCVPTSIICNNYMRDLQKACTLSQMGYVDAVVVAGMRGWTADEKDYFWEMTADSKIKVINLDELDCRYLID